MTTSLSSSLILEHLAQVIERRKLSNGGDPEKSYVAKLLAKGPDSFLKKIGEEATEAVMAAKDVSAGGDKAKLVSEMADLWFHSMVALSFYDLHPNDVLAELAKREGTSGLEEKALRKMLDRQKQESQA